MHRQLSVLVLALLVFLPASQASAQLLAAKDGPIVYGHHHLAVTSVDEHKKFWVNTLGGTAITIGTQKREIVKFPNALLFMNAMAPSGGSKGTFTYGIEFIDGDGARNFWGIAFPSIEGKGIAAQRAEQDGIVRRKPAISFRQG